MALLGEASVLIALVFCLWGLWSAWRAGKSGDARLETTARRAAGLVLLFTTLAMGALWYALVTNDTSLRYVANHSTSASPLWVKLVSLWGALEGSILLWAWLLAIFAALLAWLARADGLRPYALGVLFMVLGFFLAVNASVGSPFIGVPIPPADGRGPNALLQNHWMFAVHPVLMYIGFVGLSVPFAYAIAALITGRLGEEWLVQTRRWSITAWIFLSAAIIAGGWWSYEVLGWGGYWAWDPVENASIVPWFMATAYIHSLQIQERRRMLKGWNLGLIVAAFASTLLGTFLTRSGVVQSVHSFTRTPIGPVFFGFFALMLIATLTLTYRRLPLIRDEHQLDSPASREGAFLTGNLLFSSFAFTVLVGTLFPVFVEAFTGAKTSVGPPFFNAVGIPLGLGILFLQAIGPALTWRRITGETMRQNLLLPAILALVGGVIAFALGVRIWSVALTVTLSLFTVFVLLGLTAKALRARMRATRSNPFTALGDLLNQFPRRYGAYIAHLGVVVIAVGIAFSGGYKQEVQQSFKHGQVHQIMGHNVMFLGLIGGQESDRDITAAELLVDGKVFRPSQNTYRLQQQTVASPAIHYHFLGDFYGVFLESNPDGTEAGLKFIISPLVSWIWVGGLIIVIGAGLTLIPSVVSEPKPVKSVAQAAD